jgi:LacI family transcriptional regulator
MPTVDSDNFAGACTATRHLTALGHRRIGFLGGRPDLESSRQREQGYRSALAEAGLGVDEGLMRVGDYKRAPSVEPARELLRLADPPTAIFAANDLSALGVMDAAHELGLRIPEDLSLVGFDNVPESALTTPPLTTINQPIQQMGSAAVDLLVHLMDGSGDRDTHVRLPTELVERGSTRAL